MIWNKVFKTINCVIDYKIKMSESLQLVPIVLNWDIGESLHERMKMQSIWHTVIQPKECNRATKI